MAHLPYGFDANPMYETRQPKDEAEAWERLADVQLSLEKGEAVAPELAAWLGEAIHHAKRDPAELLRRLGVKRGRGKPARHESGGDAVGERTTQPVECLRREFFREQFDEQGRVHAGTPCTAERFTIGNPRRSRDS